MAQYSQSLIVVWKIAAAEAHAANGTEIEPAHLLLGLCKLPDIDLEGFLAAQPGAGAMLRSELSREMDGLRAAFQRMALDQARFRRRLRTLVKSPGPPAISDGVIHRSTDSRRLFKRAEEIARIETIATGVRPVHLLMALMESPLQPWSGLLAEMGVGDPLGAPIDPAAPSHSRTPTLDRFGRDLTQLARDGKLDPVIGRREEMRRIVRVLAQKRKSNAILVGEAGVGKTCIVEGLAQRIVEPNPPPNLEGKRVVEVSMGTLVAGTKYRGEFEERMQGVVREAGENRDIILFIDEIHTVLGAGGAQGSVDAANILKPALARGDLQCIGATTIKEYRNHIEQDPALERRFQMVWIDEPTRQEAVEIIKGLRPRFEEHHGLAISDEAVEAAVELSMRYLPDFRLPDKAIDLIDQACASGRIRTLSVSSVTSDGTPIGRAEIAAVLSERVRLPIERVGEDELQRLLRMEEALSRRVIGQEEAVSAVSEAVRTARAGLNDARRPIGVFLFVGTTGTGKTELAKALAEFLFDDESRLIRVDMSEYMEKHSVSRLIGAPPGYVGHDEEGQLTGPVRTNPFSVILFDEVEKAHPDVLDIFLQIFDDGRLTDSRGRRVSFSETVIILTSNLGTRAEGPARPIGFGLAAAGAKEPDGDPEAYRRPIMDAVRRSLRPELLNRIGRVVFFYPLTEPAVRRIIDKILDNLRLRLKEKGIRLELTEAADALLMLEGFDPKFGAREMERTIARFVAEPLGAGIVEGRFGPGVAVCADARDGRMLLSVQDRGLARPEVAET
jgi:ATP-dependent Clp protease ATP-binding subunit ClpC